MSKSTRSIAIALLAVAAAVLEAAPPSGWFMAGSRPSAYECNIDPSAAYSGRPSVMIKAKQPDIDGFGTMMQCFRGEQYLGKRIRFSAFVRSEGINSPDDWSGLWMRVDKGRESVAFDNMQNRSVKGTTPWRNYEVVLDVPQDSTRICMGILLRGVGTVWISSAELEVVGDNVPVTDLKGASSGEAEGPRNLGFEKQ